MAQEGLGKRHVAFKLYEDAVKIDPDDPSIKAACKRLRVSPEDIDECMRFLETGKMPSFAERAQNPADIHKRFPKLQESLDKAGFTIRNFGITMGSCHEPHDAYTIGRDGKRLSHSVACEDLKLQ